MVEIFWNFSSKQKNKKHKNEMTLSNKTANKIHSVYVNMFDIHQVCMYKCINYIKIKCCVLITNKSYK